MNDIVNEEVPTPGTNTAGQPTTPQQPQTTANQPGAGDAGTAMDPVQAQKQKDTAKKALQVQLKAAQDAVKSAQENVKAIQAQMAAMR